MKYKKIAIIFIVLVLNAVLFCACGQAYEVEKSGVYVMNTLDGVEETEYVFCVSKNDAEAETLITEINNVIAETNIDELVEEYMDFGSRRKNGLIEAINLYDNKGKYIYAYTCGMEPFNFSGAGGAYADGLDVWLLSTMAEKNDRRLQINDCWYSEAYDLAKKKGILAMGVALTENLKEDFLVSDVYLTGKQQIVSDENEGYSRLDQLKGKKIGVLLGRTGYRIVDEAIKNGELKDTETVMLSFNTDAEAFVAMKNGSFDVLVIDELPAKILINRGY